MEASYGALKYFESSYQLGGCSYGGDALLEGTKMKAYLCRLVLCSVMSNIWTNRNAVCYANHPKTEEQLLKQIVWNVRTQLLTHVKFKKTKGNVIICKAWV
jgi:hypothetical protein